jgi:hypothetical protein
MRPSTDKGRSPPAPDAGPFLLRLAAALGRCYHGALPLLGGAFLALAVTAALWPALQTPDRYAEPAAGVDTLVGAGKAGDFRAFYLVLSLALLLSLGIGRLLHALSGPGDDPDRRQAAGRLALFGLLPALAWLAGSLITPTGLAVPWFAAAFFAGALAVIYGLSRQRQELLSPETISDLGATALLLLFFFFLAGLALSTALSRSAAAVSALAPLLTVIPWLAAGLGLFATLALLWRPAAKADLLARRLHHALLLIQAPLPLLVLAAVPPPAFDADGRSFSEGSPQLTFLAILVAALLAFFWFRQWRRRNLSPASAPASARSLLAALCPWSLAAVVVFMAVTPYGLPLVPAEEFHNGEQMLPWHQLRHFGMLPYIDLNPARGGLYLVYGALNEAFCGDTAVGFLAALKLLPALLLPLGFALTWRLAGPLAGLAVALGCGLIQDQFYLVWLVWLLLATGTLWRDRPGWWLVLWCAAAAVVPLYMPTTGLATVLGTAPLAAVCAWRAFRRDQRRTLRGAAIIAAVAAALLLATPLGAVVRGLGRFTFDNLACYRQAECISAAYGWQQSTMWSAFGFELLRQGWIFGLVVAACLFLRELSRPPAARRPGYLLFILAVIPSVVLVTTWSLGRLDANNMSRAGAVSQVWAAALIPLLLLWACSWRTGTVWAALLAVVFGLYGLCPLAGPQDVRGALDRVAARPPLPPGEILLRGTPPNPACARVDFPALGQGLSPDHAFAAYGQLGDGLARILKPGETYYDLTSRNMSYIYLNKPVAASYAEAFYARSRRIQERILGELNCHAVPAVLVGPVFLGYGPERFYHLTRKYVSSFAAARYGPWTVLVEPSRVPEAGPLGSDAQLQLLDEGFFGRNLQNTVYDLHDLPVTWGRSWPAMADEFTVVADRTAVALSHDPKTGQEAFALDLPPQGLVGRDADFLLLECFWQQPREPADVQMAVQWSVQSRGWGSGVGFTVPANAVEPQDAVAGQRVAVRVLVPLGAFPRWLLSDKIDSLRLVAKVAPPLQDFSVSIARLLHLRPCAGE